MARTRATQTSSSLVVNSLIADTAWSGTVTWAVVDTAPDDGHYASNGVDPPTPGLEAAVRRVMTAVRALTDLDIRPARGDGHDADIRIFQADSLSFHTAGGVKTVQLGAWAFHPAQSPAGGDIWMGSDLAADMTPGSYGLRSLLHEIGHALGLKQPDEPGHARLPAHMDGAEFSVMSARAVPGEPPGPLGIAPGGHASTFMPHDIAALQHLYGASHEDAGDDWYGFDPAERAVQRTVWDGGGRDVYNFSAFITPVEIDLRPGRWSTTGQEPIMNHTAVVADGASPVRAAGAIHNAPLHGDDWRSAIEHAIAGSGDDSLTGNALPNRLVGRDGDDDAAGGPGRDTLHGGRGADVLDGGRDRDWLVAEAGDDTIRGAAGADGMLGGPGTDSIAGGDGPDAADGGPGRDTLAGGRGADTLKGADGDDVIDGGHADDAALGGGGADQLNGGAGDDLLIGHDGPDTVRGGTGEDTIGGAAGGDSLDGGAGDDRVVTGIGDDTATGGPGADTLHGQAGDDALHGAGGDDSLLGGGFADRLWGGHGDDALVGGWGHDTLAGGAGDDTMTGGAHGDLFVLAAGGGTDTIADFRAGVDSLDVPDPAAALASAEETGEGVTLTIGEGGTVVLPGLALAALAAEDLV